jgi:hypothetical protein
MKEIPWSMMLPFPDRPVVMTVAVVLLLLMG